MYDQEQKSDAINTFKRMLIWPGRESRGREGFERVCV